MTCVLYCVPSLFLFSVTSVLLMTQLCDADTDELPSQLLTDYSDELRMVNDGHSNGIGDSLKEQGQFNDPLKLSDESRLTQFILKRYQRAGRVSRPLLNSSHSIEVEFSLSLIQILDFDETNQVLTTNVWKRYRWKDELLTWNPNEYGGVTNIRLPSDTVWTPDIVLYNTAAEQEKSHQELINVNASGVISWIPTTIIKSSCPLDMSNFPFDEQNCTLKFGSWTYDGNKLNLSFYDRWPGIDLTEFVGSSEWLILNTTAQHNTRFYPCCADEPYQDLTFYIAVKRRTAFYVYVLILPSVLLSFLTLVLFWIPPQRPDRTSFGMSLFSSFFVLLLILVQASPPSSSSISLLGLYYCINMVMIAFSTLVSAVVINIVHHLHTRPIPHLIRLFFIDILGTLFCARAPQRRANKPPPSAPISFGGGGGGHVGCGGGTPSPGGGGGGGGGGASGVGAVGGKDSKALLIVTTSSTNGSAAKASLVPSSEGGESGEVTSSCPTRTEWKIIASVFDRLFFVLYLIGICLSMVFVFPR